MYKGGSKRDTAGDQAQVRGPAYYHQTYGKKTTVYVKTLMSLNRLYYKLGSETHVENYYYALVKTLA